MPQSKFKKGVPGSCLESVFLYHLFPCDQLIPTNPLSIPTYRSSLNTSSRTPAQTLLLFIPLWHSLKHLCPPQSPRTSGDASVQACTVGKQWQRNLLRDWLDGTD